MSPVQSLWRRVFGKEMQRPDWLSSPGLIAAMSIGVLSIALNVVVARQLVRIGSDARALTDSWIARTASLSALQDGLRDFRQQEAQLALNAESSPQRVYVDSLEKLREHCESALVRVAALSATPADAQQSGSLLRLWNVYGRQHYTARGLPTGEGSAALQAFRERESTYVALTNLTRVTRDAMTVSADRLTARSRRSTETSAVLLIGSILLTILAVVVAAALRRSTRARERAERRLRGLTDHSLGIVWEIDSRGRLRFCSNSGFDMLARDRESVIGRRALSLLLREDRETALVAAYRAAESGKPLGDLEVRVQAGDGSIHWLAISGEVLTRRDGDGDAPRLAGGRGLAVDVTRRHLAEQALAQNRRLESLGTLAGGVAHDLNNVFAAVSSYAQLARQQAHGQVTLEEDLTAIETAAQRGTSLVRRVLQFARRQTREPRVVSMVETVREVVQLLRPQTPPHVHIVVELPRGDSHVMADPTELHQLVVNIASNGLHAMASLGSELLVRVARDDSHITLTITDDGSGMAPDVLERAIEPFFTTRAVGEGTGMGLSVVHGIVEALNGTLTMTSRQGVGTTVTVTLPRAQTAQQLFIEGTSTVGTRSGGVRVLLVDDDEHVRDAVSRILRHADCEVEAHPSGTSALNVLRTDPTRYDVVITDFTMPGMSGLELAEAIQALPYAPPLIMVSGYLDDATTARAHALGIAHVLDKPVPRQLLMNTIADVTSPTPA
ncbi:MAG TPA: PAS domain S-box protein [Gemmatimonas aurantiaca]|nr:ATP-binding protein [Gemmatimonas aurantiaca]HCT58279.1 PAS domain S-box protein [Gemmatimonas aurantiaca]